MGTGAVAVVSALTAACAFDIDGSSASVSAVTATMVDNPRLEQRCGVDLVLVMDASASVRNYNNPPDGNGAVDLVAGAARAFLDAFADTNSRLAVVSYNATPITQIGLTDVSAESVTAGGAHDLAIGDPGGATGPVPRTTGYSEHARVGNGTNWEAGLATAIDVMSDARPGVPRMVVHVTDGIPTRHLDDSGNSTDVGDTATHVAEAAEAADLLKAQGIHVYSVGIGRAGSFTRSLQAVSGPDVYDQGNAADALDVANDDVILASDFDALEASLTGIASSLCSSSLTITKLASTLDAPDSYAPAAGFSFTASPDPTGGYSWLLPDSGPADARTVVTDPGGRVQFQWAVTNESVWASGLITVTEAPMRGFELQPDVLCTRNSHSAATEMFTVTADTATSTIRIPVGPGDAITCEVRNRAREVACEFDCGPRNQPPVADAGPDQTFDCLAPDAALAVALDGSGSSDPDNDPLTYRWYLGGQIASSVAPGVTLGIGVHTISLIVNDGQLDSAPDEVQISLIPDTEPPVVTVPAMAALWPPNHKYHTLSLGDCITRIEDACDGVIDIPGSGAGRIISVYSDEPEDTTGDGRHLDDIIFVDSTTVRVRAERSGNRDGRVYGVTFAVTDAAGNETQATCLAGVPHDQSGRPPVDSGAAAGYTVYAP